MDSRDDIRFINESLRQSRESLATLVSEVQGLRERLLEVVRLVYGVDNPEALAGQIQFLKNRVQYLEAEIAKKEERGWQVKHSAIAAVFGLIAGTTIPIFQYWVVPNFNNNDDPIENVWPEVMP